MDHLGFWLESEQIAKTKISPSSRSTNVIRRSVHYKLQDLPLVRNWPQWNKMMRSATSRYRTLQTQDYMTNVYVNAGWSRFALFADRSGPSRLHYSKTTPQRNDRHPFSVTYFQIRMRLVLEIQNATIYPADVHMLCEHLPRPDIVRTTGTTPRWRMMSDRYHKASNRNAIRKYGTLYFKEMTCTALIHHLSA